MSNFDIKLNNVKSEISELKGMESEFNKIITELENLMSQFAINIKGMESLKADLKKQIARAGSEKKIFTAYNAALVEITDAYEKVEQKLTNSSSMQKLKKTADNLKSKIDALRQNVNGKNDSCGYSNDPVNLCNGNYIYEKTLIEIKTAYPLKFHMFYNSVDDQKGVLGKGWFHDYETSLYKEDKTHISVILPEKKEVSFELENENLYRSSQDPVEIITVKDQTYCLTFRNGHQYIYSEEGKLIEQKDEFNNSLTFKYNDNGYLSAVVSQGEEKLSLGYEEGRLTLVSAGEQRKIRFTYTGQNMTEITYFKEDGVTRLQGYKFGYDEQNRLCQLILAGDKVCLENEYDASNRVVRQKFADGGVATFEYHDEQQEVVTIEQNMNEIRHRHDDRYRSTEDTDGRGTEKYTYNEWNQKTSHIDRNGNETRFQYDQHGCLTGVTEPWGVQKEFKYTQDHKVEEFRINGVLQAKGRYDNKGNVIEVSDALGRIQNISYDEKGHPVKVVLPDDSCMEFQYDKSGNLIRVKNASGVVNEYEYDQWHRVITTIDGNKNRTEFKYNNKDEIIQVTNASGQSRYYTYDQNGMLIKVTDFNGAVYQTEYNEVNKPEKYIDANGNVTELRYDLMWHLSERIDPNKAVFKYEYDGFGRLIKETDPYGAAILYEYDAVDNCIKKTGKLGEVYHYEYDAGGRVIKKTEPNGQTTAYRYNALDGMTEIINTYGKSKRYEYDAAGQKIKETDEAGNSTFYTYNKIGKLEKVEDKKGLWITYAYYPGGNLKKVQYSNGRFFTFRYDANGNLVERKDQDDYALKFGYDNLNQRILVTDSEGAKEEYTYDAIGNVTSHTYGDCKECYEYTATGKLSRVQDAMGNETQYTYDAMDELVQILQMQQENQIKQQTVYKRDLMERVVKITDPLGKEEVYGYNAYGQITEKTDADHYTTQYHYTDYGIPEKICYGDGKTVCYSYNQLKQLVEIQDWLGITRISVDELGRARKITTPDQETIQYEWGTHGEKKKVIYPDGYEVAYDYNGNLQLMELNMGNDFIHFKYDQAGRRIQKTDSRGIEIDYGYDRGGNIVSIITKNQQQQYQKLQYGYDAYKRCISLKTENIQGHKTCIQYEYDLAGRINSVKENQQLIRSYEYDGFGNRLSKMEDGICTQYTYNSANQLLSEITGGLMTSYEYDGRGNLIRQKNEDQEMIYHYGAMNRLSDVTEKTQAGLEQITYDYNGLGYRVGQSAALENLQGHMKKNKKYYLDLTIPVDNLLMEKQENTKKYYIWNQGLEMIQEDKKRWTVGNDRLQSPVFISDGSQMHQFITYDEFGRKKSTGNRLSEMNFGFTGYAAEGRTATYFAQIREYMPESGRFGGKDPIAGNIFDPRTLNRYAYCYNDGVNYTDRTGYWFGLDDAIAAGVGAVVGVGAQFVTDTVKGAVKGEWSYDWEDYVGAATGGAAGGVTTLYAGPIAGCAVESGVSTAVSGGIKIADGKSKQSVGELAADTAVNTGLGALFGKIVPDLKIPKITKGRGNFAAVFKAGLTKIQRGVAKHMSLKVIAKGVTAGLLGGAIATLVSGLTAEAYDKIKDIIKDIYKHPNEYKKKLNELVKELLKGLEATCPVQGK